MPFPKERKDLCWLEQGMVRKASILGEKLIIESQCQRICEESFPDRRQLGEGNWDSIWLKRLPTWKQCLADYIRISESEQGKKHAHAESCQQSEEGTLIALYI